MTNGGGSNGFISRGSGSHAQVSTPNGTSSSNMFLHHAAAAAHAHAHAHHHHHQLFGGGGGGGGSGSIAGISGKTLVALYDYSARHSRDVAFKKGDILEVINDRYNINMYRYEYVKIKL